MFEIKNGVLERYIEEDGITDVVVPDSVTTIGGLAFWGCKGLTSVTIPDGVTTIGSWAFYDCIGLTSVTIPDSVTEIGGCAFEYCTGLTSVTISDSVTTIGNFAFLYCENLKTRKANYKAFDLVNGNLVCLDYIFKDNEWSDNIEDIKPCERGYHYCTNLFEIFNFYYGEIDKDIVIYECEVGDEVIHTETSKCCTNKIKPVKRLLREDVIRILNGGK